MGTRHQQVVISKDGEMKISQYGQWDGDLSGQGLDILRYLKTGNLEKYQENLSKICEITELKAKEIEADNDWVQNYPYLTRNCGSNIHKMIEMGEVKFVSFISNEEAKSWCEGFYTIDFSKNTFTSQYYDIEKTYSLDNLPTEDEYLKE